ncbi:MAG: succinate dehydrogenase cytochrome b subunit [Syntrophotalea acetylenica]|jgi:succinate dehydrogenase / fumarate reductase cytochrome b subunit|nr:succinate dehydrogenase cytochrome b subunit [Syntrophotalea acetylenica]APG45059.1 fumarate reductase [Syntrophotalea acetylenica]MDD4457558.1 succinate dehydrogenase cytochrome b subunit [Syntrophotalea acetylenica]MDY0262344.1 succinate dehydrogenase cytochrome b subunit [Syntrophotalea acetylenica]
MPLNDMIRSAVGRKLFMAATGVALLGFVAAHLLGNLTIYLGPEGINTYAEHLHAVGMLLWVFRAGLLIAFGLHVAFGIVLTLENRRARPITYKRKNHQRSSMAGRTMIYSGALLGIFVGFHLLHFTFHAIGPPIEVLNSGLPNVFLMIVENFRHFGFALAYIIAMAALFFHLSHGFASLFQTAGLNNDATLPWLQRLSYVVAALIAAGFASIPVLIYSGLVIK